MSLKKQAFSGFVWTFTSNLGTKFTTLVVGVILARLLAPSDFGLIAMLYFFFEVSRVLVDSGFSQAIIREKEINEEDKSTVFYISLFTAVICYIALWIGAPAIARFYEEPQLTLLTRVMGLNLIFASFTIVQNAVLINELKFKTLGIIAMAANVITGLIALFLAWRGMGVMSLAIRYVLTSLITSILYFAVLTWYPKVFIQKRSLKKLFGFGSRVLLLGVMNTFFRNIYNLLIGKIYTPAILAFYSQANMFKENASRGLIDSLSKVTYPILSKDRDNRARMKENYRKILQVTSFVVFPSMILLAFVAEPMILALVGEKWRQSIPLLQILCVAGLVSHIHVVNLNVLKVYAAGNQYVLQGIIKYALTVAGVLVGMQFGLSGLMYGIVVVEYLHLLVNIYLSNQHLSYTYSEQGLDLLKVFWLNIPMAGVLWLTSLPEYPAPVFQLLVMTGTGLVMYILTAHLTNAMAWKYMVELIQGQLRKRKISTAAETTAHVETA